MNPLPRLLALGLLVVLIALAVVVSGPLWRPAASPSPHATDARTARLTGLSERVSLPLALTAVVLGGALAVSLSLRPSRGGETRAPFVPPRAELTALTQLAATSAAQKAALASERDHRARAEADALLSQQLLNRSLEEKIRLGRDLHDGIIQSLYAAGLTIESARSLAASAPAEADRLLEQTRQNLNRAIRDIRSYIAGLAPENLRQTTFTDALAAIVDELTGGRPLQFECKIDDIATARLSPLQSTEVLQIAREAMSNSLRHGAATRLTVRLHPGDNAVCLLVQDNGRGFPASAATSGSSDGHGMANMQARAARLGGSLRVESTPAAGTRIVLTLPV